MKYLILTDIHGNIDALRAVRESFDELIFLGDLVDYGAGPGEVVDWVRERQPAAVRGNHDYAMATGADCRSSPVSYALSVATREHFRPRLTVDQLRYLTSLPKRTTLKNVHEGLRQGAESAVGDLNRSRFDDSRLDGSRFTNRGRL